MDFAQPTRIEEALSLLRQSNWSILAGGTDFYPALEGAKPKGAVLDISKLSALGEINNCATYWNIGALVTWSQLISAELPAAFDALKSAGREVGSIQIQNSATIVGNICNASPAADGMPPLLCLDALVRISSDAGNRELPLCDFVTGNREIALGKDELVTGLLIPKNSARGKSAFLKLGARKYLVISIGVVAVRLEWNDLMNITDAAISIGSCSVVALRLAKLEADLVGLKISDEIGSIVRPDHLEVLSPIDDVRATAGYRLDAALEMVRRTLSQVVLQT